MALAASGSRLVAGSPFEDSRASNPDLVDHEDSGASYIFRHESSGRGGGGDIKAPNADPGDQFGASVAVDREGDSILVGAPSARAPAPLA